MARSLLRSVLTVLGLVFATSVAANPTPLPDDPRLQPLTFLTGAWLSETGLSEEEWSAPMGATMMGSFRWLKADGRVAVFELLTITAEKDGVFMRLRHHDAGLVAREERDKPMVLRLESAEAGRALFKAVSDTKDLTQISYTSKGADRIAVEVAFSAASQREPLRFDLTRRTPVHAVPPIWVPGQAVPAPALASAIAPDAAKAIFERFKKLEGSWRGKSTKGWTETVTYKPIAAGSCVMDTSFDAHPNETMVTMLCLDNDRLVMTHYCVAKNQPRLLATEASADLDSVTFTFMDGGNLGPKGREKGHMDKCVVRFIDDDRFTSRWTWYQDGKESWMEEIEHERLKADAAPAAPKDGASPAHSHH